MENNINSPIMRLMAFIRGKVSARYPKTRYRDISDITDKRVILDCFGNDNMCAYVVYVYENDLIKTYINGLL